MWHPSPQFMHRSSEWGNTGGSMPNPLLPSVVMLLTLPGAALAPAEDMDGLEIAQLTIRQRIVIRIPTPPARSQSLPIPRPVRPEMEEHKGPRCVAIDTLAGSGVARTDSVDLAMTDGKLLRAKLADNCPALDFYAGVYVKPAPDGSLCAKRDVIRARSGRACAISSFKKLKLKR